MQNHNLQSNWVAYKEQELQKITKAIQALGYTLDAEQPHTAGERFLMQAVTTESGKKLILLGKRLSDNKRVVIKGSSDRAGQAELRHEQVCRQQLAKMPFAYEAFHAPTLLTVIEKDGLYVSIQEFVEQSSPFLKRPLIEQFDLALNSFKAQERAHATTNKHFKEVAEVFGTKNTDDYLTQFDYFITSSKEAGATNVQEKLTEARERLHENKIYIEQYCGFLTHTDFVPHNFRVADGLMYLLDFSSLRFGNKQESWARFLNFMTLYNPELEDALLAYVVHNRSEEEQTSLHLMRLYRLGEIIHYYADKLEKTNGQLQQLNTARVDFWHNVLQAELAHERVSEDIRLTYQSTRDSLRSPEEIQRQIGLH